MSGDWNIPGLLKRLGLARTEAPAAPQDQAPDLSEYGVSGTPILGGFLRDAGEYNPDRKSVV